MEPPSKVPKTKGMTDKQIDTIVARLLGNKGMHDILVEVVKQLDIESIDRLCSVNTAFKEFCENYKGTGVWKPVFYHKAGNVADALLMAVEPVLRLPTIYDRPRAKINWKWMTCVTIMIQQLNTIRDPAPPGEHKPRRMERYALLLLPYNVFNQRARLRLAQLRFTAEYARGPPDYEDWEEVDTDAMTQEEFDQYMSQEHYNMVIRWNEYLDTDLVAFVTSIVTRWVHVNKGYSPNKIVKSFHTLTLYDYSNDVLVRILYDMFQEGFVYPILKSTHMENDRYKDYIDQGEWEKFPNIPDGSYGIRQQVNNNMSLRDVVKPVGKSPWNY